MLDGCWVRARNYDVKRLMLVQIIQISCDQLQREGERDEDIQNYRQGEEDVPGKDILEEKERAQGCSQLLTLEQFKGSHSLGWRGWEHLIQVLLLAEPSQTASKKPSR